MSLLYFTKMQGLGNDFMVIDAVRQSVKLTTEQIRSMADRHFGVGFDQLLLLEPATSPGLDFFYRIFNADGSEVSQCGNGARCLAVFAREQGLSDKEQLLVATRTGRLQLTHQADGQVMTNFGVPKLLPAQIPFLALQTSRSYAINTLWGSLEIGAVSLGNPHCVLQVPEIENAPVQKLGELLSQHERFPEGANIGFMQVVDRNHILLRVYERGVGETLACGSGACAAMVYARLQEWVDQEAKINLPGGSLTAYWPATNEPIFLTGPAQTVFEGKIKLQPN